MARLVWSKENFSIQAHDAHSHEQVRQAKEYYLESVTCWDETQKNILRQKRRANRKCHEQKTYDEENMAQFFECIYRAVVILEFG